MNKTFYKLPIRFDSIFDDTSAEMPMCTEKESIDQNIELLLTTCPGEHKFNKNWGCRIWNMDFELVYSRKEWEEQFLAYILEAVLQFEKRLKDITASIQVMEVAREDSVMKTTAIKKKVVVYINGTLVSTEAPCGFNYALYLGPLTTE